MLSKSRMAEFDILYKRIHNPSQCGSGRLLLIGAVIKDKRSVYVRQKPCINMCCCHSCMFVAIHIIFQKGHRIMILGERIKRIRTFRGLTQRELGLKLGYEERNADVRVAQYESGYRVPKKDTLMEIARILNVNYINFITEAPGCAEDIMQTFFWLDEDNRNTFHLFQLVCNPGKCNASDDKSVCYNDSDEWPAHAPVGMWIDYGLVNEFLREWFLRKEQLKSGEISEDEYFEWKINWPASSSSVDEKGNDKKNNSYDWRNYRHE